MFLCQPGRSSHIWSALLPETAGAAAAGRRWGTASQGGLSKYRNLAHGYAMTVHKSQGVTVDRAHVLAGRSMDRNMTYVGLSRHRDAASLYWSKDVFSSKWKLEAALGRQRTKDTTLDYSDPRSEVRIGPMRSPGALGKSTSRSFSAHSRPESSRPSELRSEMKAWRQSRGGDSKGFGRQL